MEAFRKFPMSRRRLEANLQKPAHPPSAGVCLRAAVCASPEKAWRTFIPSLFDHHQKCKSSWLLLCSTNSCPTPPTHHPLVPALPRRANRSHIFWAAAEFTSTIIIIKPSITASTINPFSHSDPLIHY